MVRAVAAAVTSAGQAPAGSAAAGHPGEERRMRHWLESMPEILLMGPGPTCVPPAVYQALSRLRRRRTKVPNRCLDLNLILSYWERAKRAYHHTAPVNMLYALYQFLRCIMEEGMERVFQRHRAAHQQLVAGLAELGMEILVAMDYRLPMRNAVLVPVGMDELAVRKRLLEDHDIEIGAGLGRLAGRIGRIGLMGHTARPHNVDRLLTALSTALRNLS